MFKTYYVCTWNEYDISGLITKAENKKDALRKLNHYLERNNYVFKLKEYDLQELDKTQVLIFIC